MAQKLTRDAAAAPQIQALQPCGPLDRPDIPCEAKTDIRENEELGSFAAGAACEERSPGA